MFSFGLAVLCFQACFIQTVFGQIGRCGNGYTRRPFDYAPSAWTSIWGAEPYADYYGYGALDSVGPFPGLFAGELATGPAGVYGGDGVGEVAVVGELPADGATIITGQVPIVGTVEFAGPVRAAGTIIISGTCGCGCAGPFVY